jgi:hypothetical protein
MRGWACRSTRGHARRAPPDSKRLFTRVFGPDVPESSGRLGAQPVRTALAPGSSATDEARVLPGKSSACIIPAILLGRRPEAPSPERLADAPTCTSSFHAAPLACTGPGFPRCRPSVPLAFSRRPAGPPDRRRGFLHPGRRGPRCPTLEARSRFPSDRKRPAPNSTRVCPPAPCPPAPDPVPP